ncbi:pyridoxamine 5'-phosphate oxidase family protein [Saccharothrix sp. NRRL B-16314]|uniref:pyridoxamine 5'-phosphate oxidase family protein n=1 Tax=Saccharothrix sp. NRRL B-16314 TaxID=1463825 RepID=UPI000524C52F|nr:pyridoxamine 5'-phosphate oxidase family protein [Saccharothrix sp. NRRL B-16314]
MTLSPTDRSTIKRGRKRAVTEREALHAVLDAALVCHLAVVVDGAPIVLPTGYGRHGDTLYLHGSTGARSLREAATGVPVCVGVTIVDGIVYARSVFDNSMNYRAAVIHGTAVPVTDDDTKLHALRAITEHLAPGSWDYARPATPKELAATSVLSLDLAEASVKIRTGPPGDEPEDIAANEKWAGVLPLRTVWGEPEPDPSLVGEWDVPPHVTARR